MKTNEAPEKIYISYKGYGVFSEDGSTERTKTSQIEYIRSDAFIEKACDAYCKACNKPSYSVPIPFCRRRCESYNNFIKNIKL